MIAAITKGHPHELLQRDDCPPRSGLDRSENAARPIRVHARRLRLLYLSKRTCTKRSNNQKMTQTKIKQSSKQAIKQPNNQTIDIETVAVLVAAVVEVAEGVPTAQVACQSSGTSRSSRGGISTNSTITSNHFARRHCKQLSDKHNVPKISWNPSRSARFA